MRRLWKYSAAAILSMALVFGQTASALADEPAATEQAAAENGELTEEAQQLREELDAQEQAIIQANTPYTQAQVLRADGTWTDPVQGDGIITAGEEGFRSICVYLNNINGDIYYRAFTSSGGWTPWAINGSHTTPSADPIEAIQFKLVGFSGNMFAIYYSTTLNDGTKLEWTADGGTAGTMGIGKYITSFQLSLWGRSTGDYPNPVGHPLDSAARDGVILNAEGPATFSNGNGAAYTGWAWNYRDRYYFVNNQAVTGWQYIDGYKYYFDETGKLVQDLEPILGNGGPFIIKINKQMCTTTVYTKDGDNGYIIPFKTFLCSPGDDTPIGTFRTPAKYRWHPMIHGLYCQYLTRITGSFLMHSLIYDQPNSYAMWADTYNFLGVARSAGCVRFKAGDAKWMYDHCPTGTTVEIYNSENPGPFDRPAIEWIIPLDQKFDPTDPEVPEAAAQLAEFAQKTAQTQEYINHQREVINAALTAYENGGASPSQNTGSSDGSGGVIVDTDSGQSSVGPGAGL